MVNQRWAVLAATLVAGIACLFVDPISRDDSHYGRMVLAGCGVGLVGLHFAVYRLWHAPPGGVFALRSLLAAACTVGWFNYFQFDREIFTGINDYTDTAYYYTNSKYLEELSYYGLYSTALLCDRERGSPRTREVRQYRDLRDYEVKPVAVAFEHGAEVKERFTPERWVAYCHDITYFLDRLPKRAIKSNFFVDHGYNPPPTWSIVGGNLARVFPVEWLEVVCHVDTVLLVGMFAALAWGFGLETVLLAMLFYVVTFSGRWPILGQAILRFDWVAALAVGMACLKKERHGLAGALLSYAAFNRIFPAIFFLGWGLDFAIDAVRHRRVAPKHARFIASAAVVGLLMVGVALAQYGPSTLVASSQNLKMHNETYSSHRVGLGDVLVYQGETTREQINEGGGIYAKERTIRSWQWPLRGAALLCIGFVALYAWRTGKRDWQLMPLAILPFFAMTNPQINYYNLRILLYLWHGSNLDKPIHRLLMALLFAVEVVTQYLHVGGFDRYVVTTSTSYGMLVYLVVLVAWMAIEIGSPQPEPEHAPG